MIEFRSLDAKLWNGKKYELLVNHRRYCPRFVGYGAQHEWATLNLDGYMTVYSGYKWDGASGAVDTADFMEGSMYHDVLCEMINAGKLPRTKWNDAAACMRDINKEEGMSWLRRWWTWRGVRLWGRVK